MISLERRKRYNFQLYPAGVIAGQFQDMLVKSNLDFEDARKEIDIYALHEQVAATLPPTAPDNPESMDYVRVMSPSGVTTIISTAWIRPDTVELVSNQKLTVVVDPATPATLEQVKNLLAAAGFKVTSTALS